MTLPSAITDGCSGSEGSEEVGGHPGFEPGATQATRSLEKKKQILSVLEAEHLIQ